MTDRKTNRKERNTMKNMNLFSAASGMMGRTTSASPKDTHGPVVKTGPTAGQNRSRNKNGQWHKRQSNKGR